ncbi:ead/Ea22-like family protein [Pseudomonas aeruginosa]
MTDHAELRRVAAQAHPDAEWFIARNLDHPNIDKPAASFIAAVNPKTVLALLDEIDRLKAENEALREALSQISNASCSDARSVVIARTVLTKGTTK